MTFQHLMNISNDLCIIVGCLLDMEEMEKKNQHLNHNSLLGFFFPLLARVSV